MTVPVLSTLDAGTGVDDSLCLPGHGITDICMPVDDDGKFYTGEEFGTGGRNGRVWTPMRPTRTSSSCLREQGTSSSCRHRAQLPALLALP